MFEESTNGNGLKYNIIFRLRNILSRTAREANHLQIHVKIVFIYMDIEMIIKTYITPKLEYVLPTRFPHLIWCKRMKREVQRNTSKWVYEGRNMKYKEIIRDGATWV